MRVRKVIRNVVLIVIATVVAGIGLTALVKFIVNYEKPEDVYYDTELEAIKSVDNVNVIDTLFVFSDKDSVTSLLDTDDGVVLTTTKSRDNKSHMEYHCISVRKFSDKDIANLANDSKRLDSFINSRKLKRVADELGRNELYFFSKEDNLRVNEEYPIKIVDLGDAYFYYYYDIDSSGDYKIYK